MTDRRWRGTWWVPGEEDDARPGTLVAGEDGALLLELVGGFTIDITVIPDGASSAPMEVRTFPLILGNAGGEQFSLLGSHAVHTNGGLSARNIIEQDLSPSRALRGVHLKRPDEPIFISSHLWLEHLLAWSARTTLRLTDVEQNGLWTGDRLAETVDIDPLAASFGEYTIGLRIRTGGFNLNRTPVLNLSAIEATESAVLDFKVDKPVTFDAFDTIDKDMQDLLTLAAYEACGTRRQSLLYNPSDDHPGNPYGPTEVEVLGKQVFRRKPKAKETFHHNFLFTLDDIAFEDVVPRWLALKEQSRMGSNVMFWLRYIANGYTGNRLLGIASAAENLHNLTGASGTKPLDAETFDRVKSKIMQSISDEGADVTAYVKNALHNRAGYKARLLDLAALPDAEAVDTLIFDRGRWASLLRDARNDLAHANERSSDDPESTPAFWLLEATYALLSLVMVSRLGMNRGIQRRLVEHPAFSWTAEHFKDAIDSTSRSRPA